jgi:hypothetical protein
LKEKFRNSKLKDRQFNGMLKNKTVQLPKEKGKTMISQILHRKLKIEKHKPHKNTG